MKSNDDIYGEFRTLWNDIQSEDTFPAKRPLLAHYTSIATLECIMANDEIWFSNPLYMNDMQELRFGILEGAQAFRQHKAIRSVFTAADSYNRLIYEFDKSKWGQRQFLIPETNKNGVSPHFPSSL